MRVPASIISICAACACAAAQTAPVSANADARSINNEASEVLAAAQAQLKALPPAERMRISTELSSPASLASMFGRPFTLDTLISPDPDKLTLMEKNELMANFQRLQQLVDPSILVTSPNDADADAIVRAFQASSPLTPSEIQIVRQSLKGLPAIAKSVGRLLWVDPADGNWHFKATVFVSKPNVVATACHVVSDLTDVQDGQLVLRRDVTAVVDFSETPLPKTGPLPASLQTFPVKKLLAAGSAQGCDVAALQISGADSIPPLTLSSGAANPKRLLVLGYPQLTDLTALVCHYAEDPTAVYFCRFHLANPEAAKVASPGNFYTSNTHDGISVLTYNANTRTGQSGSPVLDLETLRVIGVHYCCTGSDTPYALACALWHPQNLRWNEAIAAATIASDDKLKPYFTTP